MLSGPICIFRAAVVRPISCWRAKAGVDGDGGGWSEHRPQRGLCLLSLYLSYCGSKLAKSGQDGVGVGLQL